MEGLLENIVAVVFVLWSMEREVTCRITQEVEYSEKVFK